MSIESKYHKALKKVAARVNMEPKEFETTLQAAAKKLNTTPECLILEEVKLWPKLSNNRIKHGKQCNFCKKVIQIVQSSKK